MKYSSVYNSIRTQKNKKRHLIIKSKLCLAIATILSSTHSLSEEYLVTEPDDDGIGQPVNTLSWAILQANLNPGPDEILLETDVSITGVMRRLIDSDVTIQTSPHKRTRAIINGNDRFRPLFIKSGNVTINNLHITDGRAQGGDGAHGGAGLGGAVFIYDGNVSITHSIISHSTAKGGNSNGIGYTGSGGGGMFGNSGYGVQSSQWGDTRISGGGGLFDDGSGGNGAYGGFGLYQADTPRFGEGGSFSTERAWSGGFGGGGGACIGIVDEGFIGGNGGFGGGAGSCLEQPFHGIYHYSGYGGFGGSGSYAGFGAARAFDIFGHLTGHDNAGAGMGGAVFIRSGHLNISQVTMAFNSAIKGGLGAKGYGGGIFVMHTTIDYYGSNQGMPSTLPTVNACSLRLKSNFSSHEAGTNNHNHHIFDLADRINMNTDDTVSTPCNTINKHQDE